MNIKEILDVNIESSQVLMTPIQLKSQLPLTEAAAKTVLQGRHELQNILDGKDSRKFIIVGPCSIHSPKAAEDYARKLLCVIIQTTQNVDEAMPKSAVTRVCFSTV